MDMQLNPIAQAKLNRNSGVKKRPIIRTNPFAQASNNPNSLGNIMDGHLYDNSQNFGNTETNQDTQNFSEISEPTTYQSEANQEFIKPVSSKSSKQILQKIRII